MEAEDCGGLGSGHDFVEPPGIGHSALNDRQPVLAGEQAVRASDQLHLGYEDGTDAPVRPESRGGELVARLHAPDMR